MIKSHKKVLKNVNDLNYRKAISKYYNRQEFCINAQFYFDADIQTDGTVTSLISLLYIS